MPGVFTFFKDDSSKDVRVFRHELDREPLASSGASPEYKAVFSRRGVDLRRYDAAVEHELIVGHYEGLLRRTVVATAGSESVKIKRCSLFSDGWEFVYMCNTLRWRVVHLSKEWALYDGGDNVVARFNRASFWTGKRGVLRILVDADRILQALIVLSCEIVNRTVESSEVSGAAVGKDE
ncbi:hypothetical protein H4R18_005640 [Coemansia javaensis]|uniref:Uncharacterized protein n=1 Tax=Coemansia javaensis TaxID=2761396 RepID=A0A9W8H4I6_9FUNG|nr:hypothetical protein H4R18_005640 [Coemansia javaensis]